MGQTASSDRKIFPTLTFANVTAKQFVADWSRWAGTLPHEIMTGLGARVGRSYGGIR